MSKLYNQEHIKLQKAFDSENLAKNAEQALLLSEITDHDKAFIESRDMFFLSTVDHLGRPSVSYKGGDKGFVRVIDQHTLVFPSYDGNGMFLSMGNININNKVGLLFIDFEQPYRLRTYGEAQVSSDDPMLDEYAEAQLLVKVTVTDIWKNCPRYVHKYKKVETSKFVPHIGVQTPIPDWKRLDSVQDDLPDKDKGKAENSGGIITLDELIEIEKRDD